MCSVSCLQVEGKVSYTNFQPVAMQVCTVCVTYYLTLLLISTIRARCGDCFQSTYLSNARSGKLVCYLVC